MFLTIIRERNEQDKNNDTEQLLYVKDKSKESKNNEAKNFTI